MREWNNKYSLIRVLHAIPEGEGVDVFLNGTSFFNDLNFTEFSPYVYVPGGDYRLTIYPTDTKENPLIDEIISPLVNDLITIAIILDKGKPNILIIKEDTETTSGTDSKVRTIHLSPNAPTVNVIADNNELFSNVGFKDITSYKEIPPKSYKVDIEDSNTHKLITSNLIKINPNRVYTFYAVGNMPNSQIIQSLDGVTFMV